MRFFGYFILFVFNSCIAFAQKNDTLHFIWTNDTINGKLLEKTAIFLPVTLKNNKKTCFFQLDTGAEDSYLYTADTPSFLDLGINANASELESTLGTIRLVSLPRSSPYMIGNQLVVGTIGIDFLVNKTIEIDYFNQRIVFLSSVDTSLYTFLPSGLSFSRPTILLKINNRTTEFLFDTGSSMFDLITTQKIVKQLRVPKSTREEIPITSWGKIITAVSFDLNSKVISHYPAMNLNKVTYFDERGYSRQLKGAKIDGIIGNHPFLETQLLIDLKNNRIGIRK